MDASVLFSVNSPLQQILVYYFLSRSEKLYIGQSHLNWLRREVANLVQYSPFNPVLVRSLGSIFLYKPDWIQESIKQTDWNQN